MRAPKLVQHMKANSSVMTDALVGKIRASGKCTELLQKVSEGEQKEYAGQVFRDLTDSMSEEADSALEKRYVALGIRRAEQGVPRFQMFWAVCIAREYLWEYVQQECLQDEPVEFWGGVMLLRALNEFFDRILYFALLGYEKAEENKAAAWTFLTDRQSA